MAAAEGNDGEGQAARRSSIEKQPLDMASGSSRPPAFERLPDEIIQQILQLTDPSSFASLILLNSKWRSISQQADLYAHHLSRCPSYAASHKTPPASVDESSLPELRRAFAREVKRNLFDAYLRPSRTIINLVSNSISSSSCPGGEGMQFNPSPRGHHLLAYNSSRIYVIDLRGPEISVKRELKILRRPAATCIKDDGSALAVLLTEMQVDLYDLEETPPRRKQSIILDHSPRAMALSPCGSVLAAAYEGGIEVSSLKPGALATDRRAVKCDAVDTLAFSFDGTQILGTTVHAAQPNTVILSAPYYDPGSHIADDNMSALWTTSILFPNTSRDCSHAVLIQNSSREEASWTFTYDRSFETFRAVSVDDLRNGTTYFTGPIPSPASQAKLLPCTLPAASYYGELVSAGFQGNEIWLYGVPEDLDAIPDTATASSSEGGGLAASNSLNRRNSGPSMRSASRMQEHTSDARVPQWQVLCDKLRNTLVAGCKIGELRGVNTVKWVEGFGESCLRERLVVAARGVLPPKPPTEEDGIDFMDGGRLALIDFDYGLEDGTTTEITIEVGTKEPEVLEEEHRDLDTEVAIVRRRTVAQRRGNRSAVMRAATTAAHPPPLPQAAPPPSAETADDPLVPRRLGAGRRSEEPAVPEETASETQSIIEEQEALDAPYSHASPRSGTTLRRAATAAAINRRLHPQPATAGGHIQYRRADGRAEHPHESDADNWVPPPPPYQKDDPQDLPAFMRHNVAPVAISTVSQTTSRTGQAPTQTQTAAQPGRAQPEPDAGQAASPAPQLAPQPRPGGGSMAVRPSSSVSRPRSSSSDHTIEGIYDVSPPGSPQPSADTRAVATREPSTGSGYTATSSSAGGGDASSSGGVSSAPGQAQVAQPTVTPRHVNQAVPRIQTTSASTSPQSVRPPALDLQIPSPTLTTGAMWNNPQSGTSPAPRRLSNAQTWPIPPPNQGTPAVLPTGYPYSAPPTDLDANEMMARSYPPPPRPEQLASLHRRDDQAPSPRRLSGGFQVPRVPVGSRDARRGPANQQQPLSPSQHPLQQHPPPQLQHPRPQRFPNNMTSSASSPPVEDQPLIISTPKGVSGAYDPPGRSTSGRRQETPILAPVPRHPRAHERSAVLRPTVERLDTIYSVASNQGSLAYSQQQQQQQQGGGGPLSSSYLSAPSSQTARQGSSSSLNRKQSRAERSAAKNIADAKKRGWRRSKSKRRAKKKERDYDAASSAAWTDVTASSMGATAYQGQQGSSRGKGGKCVVM